MSIQVTATISSGEFIYSENGEENLPFSDTDSRTEQSFNTTLSQLKPLDQSREEEGVQKAFQKLPSQSTSRDKKLSSTTFPGIPPPPPPRATRRKRLSAQSSCLNIESESAPPATPCQQSDNRDQEALQTFIRTVPLPEATGIEEKSPAQLQQSIRIKQEFSASFHTLPTLQFTTKTEELLSQTIHQQQSNNEGESIFPASFYTLLPPQQTFTENESTPALFCNVTSPMTSNTKQELSQTTLQTFILPESANIELKLYQTTFQTDTLVNDNSRLEILSPMRLEFRSPTEFITKEQESFQLIPIGNSRKSESLETIPSESPRRQESLETIPSESPRGHGSFETISSESLREQESLKTIPPESSRAQESLKIIPPESSKEQASLKTILSERLREQESLKTIPSESSREQESLKTLPLESPKEQESLKTIPLESPKEQESLKPIPSESPKEQESLKPIPSESPKEQESLKPIPSESPKEPESLKPIPSESPKEPESLKPIPSESPKEPELLKPIPSESPKERGSLKTIPSERPSEQEAILQSFQTNHLKQKISRVQLLYSPVVSDIPLSESTSKQEEYSTKALHMTSRSEELTSVTLLNITEPPAEGRSPQGTRRGLLHLKGEEEERETVDRCQSVCKDERELVNICIKQVVPILNNLAESANKMAESFAILSEHQANIASSLQALTKSQSL